MDLTLGLLLGKYYFALPQKKQLQQEQQQHGEI